MESEVSGKDDVALEIKRIGLGCTRLAFNFAKCGFTGVLVRAVLGLLTILGLAALNSYADAKIETWAIVAVGVLVLIGEVALGYFSLWKLLNIVAAIGGKQLGITSGLPDPKEEVGSSD